MIVNDNVYLLIIIMIIIISFHFWINQPTLVLYKPLFSRTVIFAFLDFCGNSRVVNFAIFLMLSLL